MRRRPRSTFSQVQHRSRAGRWLVVVLLLGLLAWWLLNADGSPVQVLGCVWERTGQVATTTADCAPPAP